jgi:exodeoxyribonuclease VII large subunit
MDRKIITVGQVNSYIKHMFDNDYVLKNLWIQGEISNCKVHSSGHVYFTLKDSNSAINCVLFRSYTNNLSFQLKNGISIIAKGSISVYERSGQYQLYVREIIQEGLGVLYQRFEQLKNKLEIEGLFSSELKKIIPKYPKKIGIVTSDTGAAVQDIINISTRRNPYVQLVLYPSLVQGVDSAENIVRGITYLDQLEDIDVIIIGRGGGSIEDLWSFNEEIVAYSIFNANTPIISAVGHETDFTIADFVADFRAPTPSAAAEIAVPVFAEIEDTINGYENKLINHMTNIVDRNTNKLDLLSLKLEHLSPRLTIEQNYQYIVDLQDKLDSNIDKLMKDKKNNMQMLSNQLHSLSPYKKLVNGFAYITNDKGDKICTVESLTVGDNVTINFHDGVVTSTIDNITKGQGITNE